MDPAVMTMHDVTKTFRRKPALTQCTFEVERGSITALVGINGSGKSTLMSIAAGLLTPDSGTVSVLGKEPDRNGIRDGVSYLAQHKPLYPSFTVQEILHFGKKTNTRWDGEYASGIVSEASIPLNTKVKALSPGQRTRVALALVLGRRPDFVILDEPFADLDPLAKRSVAETLMRDVAEHGTTVLMSSHVVSELEDLADHLLLLGRGKVQLSGSIESIVQQHYLVTKGERTAEGTVVDTRHDIDLVQGPRPPGAKPATLDAIVLGHLAALSS